MQAPRAPQLRWRKRQPSPGTAGRSCRHAMRRRSWRTACARSKDSQSVCLRQEETERGLRALGPVAAQCQPPSAAPAASGCRHQWTSRLRPQQLCWPELARAPQPGCKARQRASSTHPRASHPPPAAASTWGLGSTAGRPPPPQPPPPSAVGAGREYRGLPGQPTAHLQPTGNRTACPPWRAAQHAWAAGLLMAPPQHTPHRLCPPPSQPALKP